MILQNEFAANIHDGGPSGKFAVNVVFREYTEDSETYVVAECLEIPGCVSEGSTREEAAAALEEAVKLCLGVLFEDCLKRVAAQQPLPDLRGISSQRRICIDATPHVAYA